MLHFFFTHIYHGSVRLAKLCKEAGIPRFLYTSSCSVYGIAKPDYRIHQMQGAVEQELCSLASTGFSPVMFRNATAFGASPVLQRNMNEEGSWSKWCSTLSGYHCKKSVVSLKLLCHGHNNRYDHQNTPFTESSQPVNGFKTLKFSSIRLVHLSPKLKQVDWSSWTLDYRVSRTKTACLLTRG